MTQPDFNLMPAILKEIRVDIGEIRQDMSDLKLRRHVLEDEHASLVMSVAGVDHRLDRMQADITTIERRLELVDAN